MEVGDKILVYGTLKSGHGSNKYFMQGRSEFVRNDRISARMFDLGAFPAIKAVAETKDAVVPFDAEGAHVSGEVYTITHEELPRMLDRYEGYPDFYGRRQFETESGERAWVYEFKKDLDDRNLVESGEWK